MKLHKTTSANVCENTHSNAGRCNSGRDTIQNEVAEGAIESAASLVEYEDDADEGECAIQRSRRCDAVLIGMTAPSKEI